MHSGMYSAVSGNISAMNRLDVISNNLANSNTNGFKKDRLAFESVLAGNINPPEVPPGMTADPVLLEGRMTTDYSAGSLAQTGNPLDIAIQGDGFFAVRTPAGIAYTRQGNFRLTQSGELVTSEGYPVLSKAGERPDQGQPIVINTSVQEGGGKPVVDNDGNVTVNGDQVAQIALYDFPKPYNLKKTSSTMFVPENGVLPMASQGTTVFQGSIEKSNVDTVSEMINMVDASRYFETCQRVIRGFDDIAAKAVNDLARV